MAFRSSSTLGTHTGTHATSKPSRFSSSSGAKGPSAALLALLAGVLVTACSSSESRTTFVADAGGGSTPDEQPEQSTPPTGGGGPSSEVDAGEPEPDTCERTAPSNVCGLAPQCGCAPTETCDIADGEGNVACIAAGKAPLGAPCTMTAGCVQGSTCVFGTCHALCAKAGEACSDTNGGSNSGSCVQVNDEDSAPIPNLKVCSVKCDPRVATACGGTTPAGIGVCFVDDDGNTDCQTGGPRTEGQTCTPTSLCGPALVCTTVTSGTTTSSVCKKWCRVGTSDCGGSKTCSGFSTKLKIDGVEYGVCS